MPTPWTSRRASSSIAETSSRLARDRSSSSGTAGQSTGGPEAVSRRPVPDGAVAKSALVGSGGKAAVGTFSGGGGAFVPGAASEAATSTVPALAAG